MVDTDEKVFDAMRAATYFKEATGRWSGYRTNPSKSQSSPWACPDYLMGSGYHEMLDRYVADFLATPPIPLSFKYRIAHPFDALLAERRAVLAGEQQALERAKKKDAAWWDERRRG